MDFICGIYKIESPSGSIYIGQSVNILKRWRDYKRYSNNRNQRILFNSFRKYGIELHMFSIICELPKDTPPCVLSVYEQFCMDQYKEAGVKMMNIRDAGNRGKHSEETKLKQSLKATGRKHTPETLIKLSLAKRGKPGNRLGTKCTPEQAERNRVAMKGKKHTEETRKKISINNARHNKGIPASELSKEKNRIAHTGNKASEETKLKMSLAAKGVPKSKEHNKKVSDALRLYHQRRNLNLSIFYNNRLKTFLL